MKQLKTLKIKLPKGALVWIDGVMQAVTPGINTFFSDPFEQQRMIKIQYYELVYEKRSISLEMTM